MTRLPPSTRLTALRLYRAHGVSILTAIFLVVVLAALGAAMVRVFTAQQAGLGLDAAGTRAELAARSGLEWGLYQQLRVQPPAVTCFPNSSFPMPASGSLASFTVTVSCAVPVDAANNPTNLAGRTTNRWTITAVACNKPSAGACPNASTDPDYVQRKIQADLN